MDSLSKDKKVIEYLEQKIKAYEDKGAQARKKVVSFNILTSRIEKQLQKHEKTLNRYKTDEADRAKQIKESDTVLSAFRKSISVKNHQMQEKYEALEELEDNIKLRASEVDFKIRKIQDALLEWHAASQIVSDNCRSAVFHAAQKFSNWHQVVPVLSYWLANEARVRSTIYATAGMVGFHEELIAQKEIKAQIEEFSEQYYKDVSQQSRLPPLKQINEQRQHRSELFDQLHVKMVKQLRGYVRSCVSLEQEIIQKEQLRMKLTSMAMEISNLINDDTKFGMSHCEVEARRKIEFILQVFQQASEGHAEHSLPEELLMELRNTANTQLELDVLELTKTRKTLSGISPTLDQPSMVSSLSGSNDSYTQSMSSPLKRGKGIQIGTHPSTALQSSLLPLVKQPFNEIKEAIQKNKGNEILKTKLTHLLMMIDQYNPKLHIIFDKLRSEREEEEFDPDNLVLGSDESNEIVNSVSTLNSVKHLQHTTVETIAESITLLQRLLDSAKKKEENALDLHYKDASRPSSSALALRMEQQQAIGYQELQKKVTKQFQRTRKVMEDWMFDTANTKFEEARQKLTSLLLSEERISTEEAEQLLVKFTAVPEMDTRNNGGVATQLPFPILAPNEPVQAAPNDETESNVRDMLSLSERLLSDLEKQLQSEVSRNQESFSMQQVKESQRMQNVTGNGEDGNIENGTAEEGDILLATAEIIMHNDLYHISLVWRQRESMATFVARNLLPKRKYKEYIMNISMEVLSEITGMNIDNVVHYVLHETPKAFQQITHHIQVEEIRPAYYEELKEIFDNGLDQDLDILMYLPHYLPFGSEIFHHHTSNLVENNVEQAQGLLLKVMTCRADHGGLLLHCFSQIRSMR